MNWHYWKYRINAILLLLPIFFIYQNSNKPAGLSWHADLGHIALVVQSVEQSRPYIYDGRLHRDFSLKLEKGLPQDILQAWINIGPVASQPSIGSEGVLSQRGQIFFAQVPSPQDLDHDDRLWLSLIAKDGRKYSLSWQL